MLILPLQFGSLLGWHIALSLGLAECTATSLLSCLMLLLSMIWVLHVEPRNTQPVLPPSSGLAERIATSLLSVFHWMGRAGPTTSVYVATVLLTALLSNGASVTLMWPVARDLARQVGSREAGCGCSGKSGCAARVR